MQINMDLHLYHNAIFHTEQSDLNSIHKTKEQTALCGTAMSSTTMIYADRKLGSTMEMESFTLYLVDSYKSE